MSVPLLIRPEAPGDEDAIRAVHCAAFGEPDEGRIVDRQREGPLHDPGLSLLAIMGDVIVGHCLLSRCQVDGAAAEVLALGPIAVLPSEGRGIGGALIRAALDTAEERGFGAVVLLGHPDYYPRFGFQPARPLGLEAPAPRPDAAWQARRLRAWTPRLRGVVCYPPSFEPL